MNWTIKSDPVAAPSTPPEATTYSQVIPRSTILPKEPEGKKYDRGKLRYDLVPSIALKEMVKVITFGAEKYTDNNWQLVSNPRARYYAALQRHLQQWRLGETRDEETGIHHLAHAATNTFFLLWFELTTEKE